MVHFVDCLFVFVDELLKLIHFISQVASLPFRSLLSERRTEQPGCRQFIGEYPISLLKKTCMVRYFSTIELASPPYPGAIYS